MENVIDIILSFHWYCCWKLNYLKYSLIFFDIMICLYKWTALSSWHFWCSLSGWWENVNNKGIKIILKTILAAFYEMSEWSFLMLFDRLKWSIKFEDEEIPMWSTNIYRLLINKYVWLKCVKFCLLNTKRQTQTSNLITTHSIPKLKDSLQRKIFPSHSNMINSLKKFLS